MRRRGSWLPFGMPSDQVYSQPELGFSTIGAGR